MKKSIFKICAIALCFVLLINLPSSYGYFQDNTKTQVSPSLGLATTNGNIINVKNEVEFYKNTRGEDFNSPELVSNANERKIIKLTNDITITDSMTVTRDCHIDLNGYKLNLGMNTITFKHAYHGSFVITNGTISAQSLQANIIVDTVNAVVIIDNSVVLQDTAKVEVIQSNDDVVVNNAFNLLVGSLSDGGYKNSIYDNVTSFESIQLPVNEFCTLNHSSGEITHRCSYFTNDIDLPTNYFNYDVSIKYETDNNDVLSTMGKVNTTNLQNGQQVVKLTATITYNTTVKTKTFDIHILDKNNNDVVTQAATALFAKQFSIYKNHETNVYDLGGAIQLPKSNSYLGISYSYETLDENQAKLFDSTNVPNLNFSNEIEGCTLLSPSSDAKYLKVIATKSGVTKHEVFPIVGQSGANIKDNYTIADSIIMNLFGGRELTIEKREGEGSLNGYSTYSLPLLNGSNPYQDKGLISLSYEQTLVNNIDKTYVVDTTNSQTTGTYLLRVADNLPVESLPNEIQSVFVKAVFTFSGPSEGSLPEVITINLPIKYRDGISGGDNINIFDPFYTFFDRIIRAKTGGYTYINFEIPANYGAGAPYIRLTKEGDTQNAVNMEMIPDTPSAPYVGKIRFTIDTSLLTTNDMNIKLSYSYCFQNPEVNENWKQYNKKSEFTVPGIVRNDASGIPDAVLYEQIYNAYHHPDVYVQGKLVLASRLAMQVDLFDLSNIKNIANYKGLELLQGLKGLNLSSSGLSSMSIGNKVTQISSYIAPLVNLEMLNLSNNALSDSSGNIFGIPTSNNRLIQKLSPLKKLRWLHLENNKIFRFTDLRQLPSLEDVCVFANKPGSSEAVYGANGLTNKVVYISLTNNGVKVHNVSEDKSYIVGSDNDAYARYLKLANIEYQDKLPMNVPLYKIWQEDANGGVKYISTTPGDYGFTDKGGFLNVTPKITIEAVIDEQNGININNATNFIVKYTYGSILSPIDITCEFEIQRIQ